VKEKMTAANWLIKAIEQRKTTMLRVMNALIEFQLDFFEKGPAFLNKLVMQQVADKINMHVSTVSRVANGKYAQTPHGIYELKYFFTAGVEQEDGSEVSATTATETIKELVENEDPKRPLSDQKIVALLKAKNMDIARRTVAKYRDRLRILPARLRKQY
jgi:RNA polymerase sigma-54 factor